MSEATFIGGAVAEISRKLPRKTCFLLSDKYRAGVDGIIGTYRGMFNYHMVKFLPARKYKSDRYSNDAACSHRVRCIVDCPQKVVLDYSYSVVTGPGSPQDNISFNSTIHRHRELGTYFLKYALRVSQSQRSYSPKGAGYRAPGTQSPVNVALKQSPHIDWAEEKEGQYM